MGRRRSSNWSRARRAWTLLAVCAGLLVILLNQETWLVKEVQGGTVLCVNADGDETKQVELGDDVDPAGLKAGDSCPG